MRLGFGVIPFYYVVEVVCSVAVGVVLCRRSGHGLPHGVKGAARSGSSGAAPPNVVVSGYASSVTVFAPARRSLGIRLATLTPSSPLALPLGCGDQLARLLALPGVDSASAT